jgi:general stress protein YciG
VKNDHDSGAPGASTDGASPLQLEPLKVAKKRCKGVTKNGTACTAWAMEGGLCYFHANPDKASELGKRGGRARSPTGSSGGAAEYIARRPLKSVDDVTKLLADTINDLRSGAIDSRLANTVGFLATGMLKAIQQGDMEGRLRAMEAVLSSDKTPRKR